MVSFAAATFLSNKFENCNIKTLRNFSQKDYLLQCNTFVTSSMEFQTLLSLLMVIDVGDTSNDAIFRACDRVDAKP